MAGHINRLGRYVLNLKRTIPEADYSYKPGEVLKEGSQKSSEMLANARAAGPRGLAIKLASSAK